MHRLRSRDQPDRARRFAVGGIHWRHPIRWPCAIFPSPINQRSRLARLNRDQSSVSYRVSTETTSLDRCRDFHRGCTLQRNPQPHRLRSASLCQQQRRKPKMHCSNRTCLASTTLWTSACSCWTGAARLTTEHHSTISRNGPPFRRPDQQETMVINHHGLTNKTMKKRELEKISRVQECFGAREWRRK